MSPPFDGLIGLVVAYVAGSFPSAYLAGRLLKGTDLRSVGSGNLGATNVYRELGAVPAIVVLLVDVAKGWAPVALLPPALGMTADGGVTTAWWALAFGAAAIAGHAKPLFLLWKGGGKGVATGAGVFAALTPVPLGLAVLVFAAVVAATRYVSLASIVAAVALPAFEWMDGRASPAFWASVAIGLFVVWAHRANMERIRAGTERRLGRAGTLSG